MLKLTKIVSNNGYLKLNDVLELKNKGTDFSIYDIVNGE